MRELSMHMEMRGAALMTLNASTPTFLTKLPLFSRPRLVESCLHRSLTIRKVRQEAKNTPIKINLESKIMMVDKRDKGSATSPMEIMAGEDGSPTTNTMRTAETLLRLLPIAPCVAALVVMLHDSQTNDFGSISYSHLGSFRYLVHANAICAGYSLLSAIISAMRRPFSMSQAWTFFFLDQVLTYLILGAGAVSTEVLYLAYNGDLAITWTAACESFGRFCHKGTASVAITFLVVACYALLSLISSYRLFSNYEAPAVCNTTKEIEAATFHG